MEPFVKFTGIVAPLDRTNIDTDAIIPKQFLKRIEKQALVSFYSLNLDLMRLVNQLKISP